jgi:hypothetical protein
VSTPAQTGNDTSAAGEGDVVEQIEPSREAAPATSEPSAGAAAPAATESRIQASGFARQSFEVVYGELARQLRNANPLPLWRDVFVSRTQLMLRSSYQKGRHFEATLSGVLGYTLHVAAEVPQYSVGTVDLQEGEVEPDLRDAYLGFYWPGFELRIGQQRVAWGRADFQSPNDVINARDLRDPFLTETELRHLPTPVIRASISGGPVTFEGVVSPFFVPDRYDVYGSNWAAVQRRTPAVYQAFLGNGTRLVDPSIERDFATLWRQTERPPDNGRGASAGARLSANLPGIDLDAYYQYGFDSLPAVSVDPAFSQYLANTDFTTGAAANFAPLLDLKDRGIEPFTSRYVRRHHIGFDLATASEALTFRLDGGYDSKRVFYTPDLTSFESPALLGVASLEYQTGNLNETVLVEFLGAHIMHDPGGPLLVYKRDTAAVAATVRWLLTDNWGIDLRGLFGAVPQSLAVQPALRYDPNGAFSLRLGVLVLSGKTNSFGWYYGDNDSAYIQLRYAF